MRKLLISAALVVASACPAAAQGATANWAPQGTVQQAGSVTLKLAGGTPIECSGFRVVGWASAFIWTDVIGGVYSLSCDNGQGFDFRTSETGTKTGTAYSVQGGGSAAGVGSQYSPYGAYAQSVPWTVPFVNGTVGQASTLTFSNTVVGLRVSDAKPISMTGTLDVTTTSGGLVTLN